MKFEILQNGKVVETKELKEGQYKIGRAPECEIRFKSTQVSKNHGLLVVKGDQAAVVDTGSSNGIFVNGILVRKQKIEKRDVISIAEFQIRIASTLSRVNRPQAQRGGSQFNGNAAYNTEMEASPEMAGMNEATPEIPQSTPQERLQAVMDQKILAPFYHVLRNNDWRFVLATILIFTLVLTVLLSVFPIVRWGKMITTQEALERGHAVLAQVVRENYRILSKTSDTTRLTVEIAEKTKGILQAYIVDGSTQTVLAPAKYFNTTLTDTDYQFSIKKVIEGKETKVSTERDSSLYVLAQPIPNPVNDAEENPDQNPAAIVVADFEIPNSVTAIFEPLVEALLIAVFLALLAYYAIWKMFAHPISVMSEQLDSALKGDNVLITATAKMSELENLAQVINFAITRMRQAGGGLAQAVQGEDPDAEDALYVKGISELDIGATDAILVLDKDRKIRFVGHVMEELVNMRNATAQGQNISDACKDTGFAGTCLDLTERVFGSIGDTQSADLDINGIRRNVTAVGHKASNTDVRIVVLIVKMGGGSE